MIWQDLINGSFETFGCFFIMLHIIRLIKDKKVRGISVLAFTYFTLWGFWNCYYYPYLEQWMSFIGGLAIAIVNAVYVGLMFYYTRKEKNESIP